MFWLGGTGGPQQKAAAAGAGIGWDSRNSAASGWAVAIRVLSKPRPQRPPRTPPCRGMAQVAHGCATTRVRTGMSARGMGHAPAGRRPPPKPAPRSNAPPRPKPALLPNSLGSGSRAFCPAVGASGPRRRCSRALPPMLPSTDSGASCLAGDAFVPRHRGSRPRRRCSRAPASGLFASSPVLSCPDAGASCLAHRVANPDRKAFSLARKAPGAQPRGVRLAIPLPTPPGGACDKPARPGESPVHWTQ